MVGIEETIKEAQALPKMNTEYLKKARAKINELLSEGKKNK